MAGGGSKSASKAAGSDKALAVIAANRNLQQGRITRAEMNAAGVPRNAQLINAAQMQKISDNRTAERIRVNRMTGADGRRIPEEARAVRREDRPTGTRRSQLEKEIRERNPSWNERQIRATIAGRLGTERILARERRQMARDEAAQRRALQESERARSSSSQSGSRSGSFRRDSLSDLALAAPVRRVPRSSSANRRLATRIAASTRARRDSLSDLDF